MCKWTGILLLFGLSWMIPAFGHVLINPVIGNVIQAESSTAAPPPEYTPAIVLDKNADIHIITPAPIPVQLTMTSSSVDIGGHVYDRNPGEPIKEVVISGNIKVQAYNFIRSAITRMITPRFKIWNTGSRPIKLSTVKIRYYYTVDGIRPQDFRCRVSSVEPGNITGTFVKMPGNRSGANYYLEIGFTESAGKLPAGTGIDIQTRFAKTGDSEYRQSNDYSFNSAATGYVDWTKTTGYISGVLKWGEEP
jgi:hypothetical protein